MQIRYITGRLVTLSQKGEQLVLQAYTAFQSMSLR